MGALWGLDRRKRGPPPFRKEDGAHGAQSSRLVQDSRCCKSVSWAYGGWGVGSWPPGLWEWAGGRGGGGGAVAKGRGTILGGRPDPCS